MTEEFDDQYADDLQKEDKFSASSSNPRGLSRAPVFVYDHGFTDGILEIDREAFEKVIEETELKKLSSVRLGNIRQQIQAKQEELRRTREELLRHKEEAIRSRQEIEYLQRQVLEKEDQKVEHQEEVNRLTEWYRSIDNFYGWVPAILFFVAGLVFIGTDVSITYEIVSKGLNLEGWEAWFFAIGLACMAFIIKPAVDRVFEKPYLNGENKRRNHIFLIIVGISALVALGILGGYRSYAVNRNEELANLREEIQTINREVALDETGTKKEERDQLLERSTQLSGELYNHWTIVIAFILSSMIFALAGAISLSIGFPALTLLYRKEKATYLKWRENSKVESLEKTIQDIRQRIARKMGDVELAEYHIELLSKLEKLEEFIQELLQKEDAAIEEFFRRRIEAEKAWYLEGYERGDRYDLTGRLLITPYQFDSGHGINNNTKKGGSGIKSTQPMHGSIAPPETDGKFLYQQIRDRIRYNIDKQYHHPNGKSHE